MHQKMREDLMCGAQEARGTQNEINQIQGIKVDKSNGKKSVSRHTYIVLFICLLHLFICLLFLFYLLQTDSSLLTRKMMLFLSFQRLSGLHTVRYRKTYCYLCMLII